MLYVGTVVTGSGPHAGDADTERNGLDPRTVSQLHADLVFLFVGLTIGLLFAVLATGPGLRAPRGRRTARRRARPGHRRLRPVRHRPARRPGRLPPARGRPDLRVRDVGAAARQAPRRSALTRPGHPAPSHSRRWLNARATTTPAGAAHPAASPAARGPARRPPRPAARARRRRAPPRWRPDGRPGRPPWPGDPPPSPPPQVGPGDALRAHPVVDRGGRLRRPRGCRVGPAPPGSRTRCRRTPEAATRPADAVVEPAHLVHQGAAQCHEAPIGLRTDGCAGSVRRGACSPPASPARAPRGRGGPAATPARPGHRGSARVHPRRAASISSSHRGSGRASSSRKTTTSPSRDRDPGVAGAGHAAGLRVLHDLDLRPCGTQPGHELGVPVDDHEHRAGVTVWSSRADMPARRSSQRSEEWVHTIGRGGRPVMPMRSLHSFGSSYVGPDVRIPWGRSTESMSPGAAACWAGRARRLHVGGRGRRQRLTPRADGWSSSTSPTSTGSGQPSRRSVRTWSSASPPRPTSSAANASPTWPGRPTPSAPPTALRSRLGWASRTCASRPRGSSTAARTCTPTTTPPTRSTVYGATKLAGGSGPRGDARRALRPPGRLDDGRRARARQEVRQPAPPAVAQGPGRCMR